MVLMLTTLLLLGAVSPALSQNYGVTECSSNPQHYGGYQVESSNCCTSFVITALLRLCCLDGATCRCSPTMSVTCPQDASATLAPTPPPTTTTTTPMPTPTPYPPVYTPAPPPTSGLCPSTTVTARLLNSAMVTSGACTGSGTIGFTTPSGQVCNGAYGKDYTTGEGVIFTLSSCWATSPTAGIVGSQIVPFDSCTITSATQSPIFPTVTTLSLSPMATFFLDKMFESCPTSDCLYNPFTMQTAIDWRKCYISSYGATTMGGTGGVLNMIPVSLSDATMCFGLPAGSQCFVSTSGSACVTDNAAPLYCSLTSGEQVLYGLTTVNSCVSGATSFTVMPIFGALGKEVPLP